QPHDHGALGAGRGRHRDGGARRTGGRAPQPVGVVLGLARAHRHQYARARDRGHVRRHVGRRVARLAARANRGALEHAPRRWRLTVTDAPDVPALAVSDPEQAVSALRASGLRLSTARRLVIEALFAADDPVSASELAGALRIDESSVYRNLEVLE